MAAVHWYRNGGGLYRYRSNARAHPYARAHASSSSSSSSVLDVAVLGAGAAGLTAAFFAAQRLGGLHGRVAVLERTGEAGKKILMSGGSRCNVMPAIPASPEDDFFTAAGDSNATAGELKYAKKVAKLTLNSWHPEELRHWFEHDVKLSLTLEESTQKLFPTSNSAREVRNKLVEAVEDQGGVMMHGHGVSSMKRLPSEEHDGELLWHLYAEDPPSKWSLHEPGALIARARAVVVATGGLSFPAVGTDGTGHKMLRDELGVRIAETYPALVPLLGVSPAQEQLAGVSLSDVRLQAVESGPKKNKRKKRASTTAHRSGFLFTHKGFSGPSVLDLSHRVILARQQMVEDVKLMVEWTGDTREEWADRLEAQRSGGGGVRGALRSGGIPQRLADALMRHADVPLDRVASELRKGERERLLTALAGYELEVGSADGGFKKAEVSGGGVPLSSLKPDGLALQGLENVFCCGEICDVHGRIGGFNFLWAWTSGRLAGLGSAAGAAAAADKGEKKEGEMASSSSPSSAS